MRHTPTRKQVTFEEAINLMKGISRCDLAMGYHYINDANEEVIVRSRAVSTIYRDWYGECNCCPPNDTVVKHLHILLPNHVSLDVVEDVQFGTLMDTIEDVTFGSNYRDA